MTILAYNELCEVVEKGYLDGLADHTQINATSIDIRLGYKFLLEHWPGAGLRQARPVVDLAKRESVQYKEHFGPIQLNPSQFCLAGTLETFNLPDWLSCEFCLKSSLARNGLEHLNACWIDAGFNNSVLTLELKNMLSHHVLALTPGMLIGQLKFFRHAPVPPEQSYRNRGRYNGDHSVQAIKP